MLSHNRETNNFLNLGQMICFVSTGQDFLLKDLTSPFENVPCHLYSRLGFHVEAHDF